MSFIAKVLPEGNLKNRFKDIKGIENLPIAETGTSSGMPFIRLRDGVMFHGVRPSRIQRIIYRFLCLAVSEGGFQRKLALWRGTFGSDIGEMVILTNNGIIN